MPTFQVKALDANGAEVSNSIKAHDAEQATHKAHNLGYLVTEIIEQPRDRSAWKQMPKPPTPANLSDGVPPNRRVLQWGLFGPRQSGKTVGLSVLKLIGQGADLVLEVVDRKTLEYFRPLTDRLVRGEFPPATPPKVPDRLAWIVHRDSGPVHLRLEDFAGELTDPIWQAGSEEFKARVLAWIKRCDAIVLFIDGVAPDPHYTDMIDSLLHVLETETTRHGSCCRVLTALYTKMDRMAHATPEKLRDPNWVAELLGDHPVYQRLERQLQHRSDRIVYQHFPCSAVGFEFESVPDKARRQIKPCNLLEAVRWTLDESEKIVAATHGGVLEDTLERLQQQEEEPRLGLTNYGGLMRQLDEQVSLHRLDEGPESQRVVAAKQTLVQKRGQQRRKVALSIGFVALVVSALLWYQGHARQEAIYDEYETLLARLPQEEDASARLNLYYVHIASRKGDFFWGLHARRVAADEWAEADRRLVAQQEAKRALADVLGQDPSLALAGQDPRRHQAVLAYLDRHRAFTPEERFEPLLKILRETRAAWEADRNAWKAVSQVRIASAADYGRRIRQLSDYAEGPAALHTQEALELAKKLAEQERKDQQIYTKLCSLPGRSRGELEDIEATAREYLALSRTGVAMQGVVQSYLAELDKFKGPRNVYLTLSDIEIPRNFPDRVLTGNPRLQVTVTIGQQSYSTAIRETVAGSGGFSYSGSQTLGPFRVSYREQESMTVKLTIHRAFFASESAQAQLKGKTNVRKHLNRTWNLSRNGTSATLTLACSEALPPPLQTAYGETFRRAH